MYGDFCVTLSRQKCMLLGDFNGHSGKDRDEYKGLLRRFGYGSKNAYGERMLEFADSFELKILIHGLKKMWIN